MGFFSKLFKGPEIDMEKSDANAKKMRALFHQAVGGGDACRGSNPCGSVGLCTEASY